MDPVLQRAMFQQQQQQQQAMTEADNVKSAQGLQAVAQQMQNVNTEIDNAEDVAGIMNAIRGDDATVEQRRAELAQEVGEADANATPESVLVMLQPTFEMMESLTGQSPDMPMGDAPVETFTAEGTGITSGLMPMPDEGKKKDNFRSEEAIARINAGETPVKARDGFYVNPLFAGGGVNFSNLNNLNLSSMPSLNVNTVDIPPADTKLTNTPEVPLVSQNPEMLNKITSNLMSRFNPLIQASAPVADTKKFIADRSLLLEPYITKAYTPQENLAQLKSLYGDSSGLGVPTNLAIAKAGAQIAQGTGSLGEAVLGAIPGVATELSQISLLKRKEDRDLLGKASELSIKQKQDRNAQLSKFASDSLARSDAMKDNYLSNIKSMINTAVSKGVDVTQSDMKTIIDTAIAQNSQEKQVLSNQFKYAKFDKAGNVQDVKMVYRSANPNAPLLYWDANKEDYFSLPDGYEEVDDSRIAKVMNQYDKSNATTQPVTWYDKTANDFAEATLFTYPGQLGSWLTDPTDGKWKKLEDVDAATNVVFGKKKDLITRVENKTTGETYLVDKVLTPKGEPLSQRLLEFDKIVEVDEFGNATEKRVEPVSVAENSYIVRPLKLEAVTQPDPITNQPTEVFVASNTDKKGTALAYQGPSTGLTFQELGAKSKAFLKTSLYQNTDLVNSIDAFIKDSGVNDIAGFRNLIKRGYNSVIPPLDFTRSNNIFQSFISEERNKERINLIQRKFVAANTFSEKYPIKEQELLMAIFPNGSAFETGKVTMAKLLALRTDAINNINRMTGVINNTQPVQLEYIPSGSVENDAIPLDHVNASLAGPDGNANERFTYLNQLIFQKRQGDKLENTWVEAPKSLIIDSLREKADKYEQIGDNATANKLRNQADQVNEQKTALGKEKMRFVFKLGTYGILD